MTAGVVSERMELMWRAVAPFMEAIVSGPIGRMPRDRPVADFAAGNPQEGTLPEFLAALQRWSVPQNTGWFAYRRPDPRARATAASALRQRLDLPFELDDVFLARGASGGLAMALSAVTDPGDEVIFLSPPWFFYEAMILAAGGVPVRVRVDSTTYDLDVPAIAAALGPRTRAVVVNPPHNPTGKISPPATLERLAATLTEASARHGHPIYLISDEAYSRILFDGHQFHTPGRFYPRTLLLHTYSKSALAP